MDAEVGRSGWDCGAPGFRWRARDFWAWARMERNSAVRSWMVVGAADVECEAMMAVASMLFCASRGERRQSASRWPPGAVLVLDSMGMALIALMVEATVGDVVGRCN